MLADTSLLSFISPASLRELGTETPPVVLDVRSPDAFEEVHVPGSLNMCVYETAFTEKVQTTFSDTSTRLILVGQGGGFKADQAAAARLFEAGYRSVELLEGGLDAWVREGHDVKGTPVATSSVEGVYILDPGGSRVYWTGRNLGNQHMGQMASKAGHLEVDATGLPLRGNVEIDMSKMTCEDLEDSGMAQMLIGHLASVDFWDVQTYPLSGFEIKDASPIQGSTPGSPNVRVKGIMTARGHSLDLEIEALIAQTDEGLLFKSVFDFDRTRFGALYGSGRIFERLGMHLVQDFVSMDIRLVFKRQD